MADIRAHPEQDQEHEGASNSELLIEAARRNNTDLLSEIIASIPDPEKLASLLNDTKTVLGNYAYHEAALHGNYEVIDKLLDCEGFECDPISIREGDTPLHSAVRYINSQDINNPDVTSFSVDLIQMMVDAGSDPRIKNKANLTPYQLTDPRNEKLREVLQNAVDVMLLQGDFVNEREEEAEQEEDDGGMGSGSDSDFDPEEHKLEVERRKKEKAKLGSKS